jgi:hypothetical protein
MVTKEFEVSQEYAEMQEMLDYVKSLTPDELLAYLNSHDQYAMIHTQTPHEQMDHEESNLSPTASRRRLTIFVRTAIGILWASLRHPGEPLIINKSTGKVDVLRSN